MSVMKKTLIQKNKKRNYLYIYQLKIFPNIYINKIKVLKG